MRDTISRPYGDATVTVGMSYFFFLATPSNPITRYNESRMGLLESARAFVAKGDLVAALDATLDAWSVSRDPELAKIVALLSDRILSARKKEGKGIRDHAKWLAAAEDASADIVGRLAPTMFAAKQLDAKARFSAAQDWPPDPRMARAVEAGLLEPPWVGRGMQTEWSMVFAMCVRHVDLRLVETLERLAAEGYRRGTAADTGAWMTEQCAQAARSGRAALATMARPDMEARDALARELAATERGNAPVARSEQELLEAIWADPASDGPRLVYGDFLLERGDSRGELLALEFKTDPTDADRARIDVLRGKYLKAIHGPLHGGIDPETAVIERGFLARARIAIRLKKDVARLHGHPAWATLRELRPSGEGQPVAPGFWGTGVFRDLRSVWGLDAEGGRSLLSAPPGKLAVLGAALDAETVAYLSRAGSLRNVHLSVPITRPWNVVAPDVAAALRGARGLDRLELGFFVALDDWLPRFLEHDPGCAELVKAPSGDAVPEKSGEWFVLRRDAQGRRSILELTMHGEGTNLVARERNVDHVYRIFAEQLARLDPGLLTEIRITSSRPGTAPRAALEAAARRQSLTHLELPASRL